MPLDNTTPIEHLTRLRENIAHTFNLEELRRLTFDLGVDYEELRGEGKSAKIQALLERLELRRRIPTLLVYLQQHRSDEA